MKTYPASTRLRPRSFDRVLLTLLLSASTAMLIVACSQDRAQKPNRESSRAFSTSEEAGPSGRPEISHPSYAIDRRWSRVPEEMAGGIDAAINWEDGQYSWFRGKKLAILGRQPEGGSGTGLQSLESAGTGQNAFWPGLHLRDLQQVDAALNWDRNTAYFFIGEQYIVFDQVAGTFASPRLMSSKAASNPWRELPPSFQQGIDAAVNDGLGNVLLFKGEHYLRFDRYLGQVLEGPVAIADRWPMLPQEFHSGIDAAMRLGRGKVTLFRDGLNVEVITSEAL